MQATLNRPPRHATIDQVNAELREIAVAVRMGGRVMAYGVPYAEADYQRSLPGIPAFVRDAPVVKLEAVEAAFTKAKAAGVQFPRLLLGRFAFSPAGATSANAGGIYVKEYTESGGMPGRYLGKVLGGKFLKSRECTPKDELEITAVCEDPKTAALSFGRKTGRCSVCNRKLTDPVSVANGIGPICADRFGF